MHPPTPAAEPRRVSRRFAAGLVLAVLAVTAGMYAWVGTPAAIGTPPAVAGAAEAPLSPASAAEMAQAQAQFEAMVARLAERMKTQPEDVEGWSMLGRSQMVMGRPAEAVVSLRKRLALEPKDALAMADLADAITLAQGRRFDGEPEQLLAQALQADPNQSKALELAGTMAFDRNDFKTAAALWGRAADVLAAADPNSRGARNLRAGIEEAQRRGGFVVAASASALASAPAPRAQAATAGAQVSGRVELSPALKAQVQPEDTVLIFARVVDGPRMPVAALRRQAKELPLDFVLDEKAAMSPNLKLSPSMRVTVGVRISKSGQAMAQSGDLQGFSEAVPVGTQGLRIEINQRVP